MKLIALFLTFFTLAVTAAEVPRILIVVGPSQRPGSHEVAAGGRLMKHCLENMANVPGVKADVVEGWPEQALRNAAGTVVFIGDFSRRIDCRMRRKISRTLR